MLRCIKRSVVLSCEFPYLIGREVVLPVLLLHCRRLRRRDPLPSVVGIHNTQAVGALSAEADVWSELEGRFNDVLAASQLLDLVSTGTDELIRSAIYFGELFGSLVIRKARIARRLVK